MNQKLLEFLQSEENVKDLLAQKDKSAKENPEHPELGIKAIEDFFLSKGITDCQEEDIKEIVKLADETQQKLKTKNIGIINGENREPTSLSDSEVSAIAGGYTKTDYAAGQEDFDYKGQGKYWRKLIWNIAAASMATIAIGGAVTAGVVVANNQTKKTNN